MKKPISSKFYSSMNVVSQVQNNPLSQSNGKANVSVNTNLAKYDKLKPIEEVKEKNTKKYSENSSGLIPARNRNSTKDVANIKGKLNHKKNNELFVPNFDHTGDVIKKEIKKGK